MLFLKDNGACSQGPFQMIGIPVVERCIAHSAVSVINEAWQHI